MTAPARYTTESVTWIHRWAPHLFSFRITRPDSFRFTPGQFGRLGLAHIDRADQLVWRAYSMASARDADYLEFYSILVPGGEFSIPLARLDVGSTILVDRSVYGFLTADRFEHGKDLWMLATGTGLAPFVAMLGDERVWHDYENLVVVHSVRETHELAYRKEIEALRDAPAFAGAKLHYIPTLTREYNSAGMLDGRITTRVADGLLEARVGIAIEPLRARALICGNPGMVAETRKLLSARGFAPSRRASPGQFVVENYW